MASLESLAEDLEPFMEPETPSLTKPYGRKEVVEAQKHFNGIRFQCLDCRFSRQMISGEVCSEWQCPITDEMRRTAGCPKWQLKTVKGEYAAHLHLRSDVENIKNVFNRVRFNCSDCVNRCRATPLAPWRCSSWGCELTKEMEERTDCPRWQLDEDIPF